MRGSDTGQKISPNPKSSQVSASWHRNAHGWTVLGCERTFSTDDMWLNEEGNVSGACD